MSIEVYTPFQRCMQTVLDTALHVTVAQSGHERTVIKKFVDHDPAGYQRFEESIHQFNPFPNPHPAMQIEISSLFGAGELGKKAAQETVIKVIAVSTGFPRGVVNLMISYCFDAVQNDFNYGVELVKQGFPKGKLFEVKIAMLLFNLKNPHKLPNEGTVYSPFQLKLLQVAQHADERYAACSQLQNWTGFNNGVEKLNWVEDFGQQRYKVFAKRSTIIDDTIKDYINRLLQFIPYPCPSSVEMETEILYRLRAELMAQKKFRLLDNPRRKEDVDAREAMMRDCFPNYPIDNLCQKQLLILLAAADCDNRKAS